MNTKKLIFSLLVVAAVGATAVSATRALLADTATLGASTFSTGTVDLQIKKLAGDTFGNGPVTGFEDTIMPGTSKDYEIWLKNNTEDTAFSLSGLAQDKSGTIANSDIKIAFTPVNDNGSAIDGAPTVTKTMTQWLAGANFGTPAFNLPAEDEQRYKMTVEVDDDVTNGGTVTFSFQFTGTQVVPTP